MVSQFQPPPPAPPARLRPLLLLRVPLNRARLLAQLRQHQLHKAPVVPVVPAVQAKLGQVAQLAQKVEALAQHQPPRLQLLEWVSRWLWVVCWPRCNRANLFKKLLDC